MKWSRRTKKQPTPETHLGAIRNVDDLKVGMKVVPILGTAIPEVYEILELPDSREDESRWMNVRRQGERSTECRVSLADWGIVPSPYGGWGPNATYELSVFRRRFPECDMPIS